MFAECSLPVNDSRLKSKVRMQRVVRKFRSFKEAAEADRDFYESLSGNQRVDLLLELVRQRQDDEADQRLKRVYQIVKLPRR